MIKTSITKKNNIYTVKVFMLTVILAVSSCNDQLESVGNEDFTFLYEQTQKLNDSPVVDYENNPQQEDAPEDNAKNQELNDQYNNQMTETVNQETIDVSWQLIIDGINIEIAAGVPEPEQVRVPQSLNSDIIFPVQFVMESLGFEVYRINGTQQFVIFNDETSFMLVAGQQTVVVNDIHYMHSVSGSRVTNVLHNGYLMSGIHNMAKGANVFTEWRSVGDSRRLSIITNNGRRPKPTHESSFSNWYIDGLYESLTVNDLLYNIESNRVSIVDNYNIWTAISYFSYDYSGMRLFFSNVDKRLLHVSISNPYIRIYESLGVGNTRDEIVYVLGTDYYEYISDPNVIEFFDGEIFLLFAFDHNIVHFWSIGRTSPIERWLIENFQQHTSFIEF